MSIYSALIANLFIAVNKFVADSISNSLAIISEGIHSLVDTVNELLLLFGINQSKKPPDDKKPFGYGKELFYGRSLFPFSFLDRVAEFLFTSVLSTYCIRSNQAIHSGIILYFAHPLFLKALHL